MWVVSGCPTQLNTVVDGVNMCCQICHRKGLGGCLVEFVHLGDILKYSFIDCTRHYELEIRVVASVKVPEVLMAKGFKDDARNQWLTAFAIVLVIHLTASPLSEVDVHILLDVCHYHVHKVAAGQSAQTGSCYTIVPFCSVDAKCANVRVVWTEASITVHAHTELKRHRKTAVAREIHTSASHIVGKQGSALDVVAIVISTLKGRINMIWHASPLGIITASFKTTGHSTACTTCHTGRHAGHIAHTASKTDTIRCDDTAVIALVAQHHAVVIRVVKRKIKRTKINPSAATHLLVYAEGGVDTFVTDNVCGIAYAVGQGLVGNIDGIFAFLLHLWEPSDGAELTFARLCLHHSCRTVLKG